MPTSSQTESPTESPSVAPSSNPSSLPSAIPSEVPSSMPSVSAVPSSNPSSLPSESAAPSSNPSSMPSVSAAPSSNPSSLPSVSAAPSSSAAQSPTCSLVTITSTSSITVGIYSQPLLNGANDVGDCGTESDNLVSIVKNFIKTDDEFTAFTTDTDQSITITSFGDPSLADKLAAMNIFFMVDIENELDGWNPTSQGILNDFVSNGGTLLMTGTSGGDDVQFLNEVFGWDLSNVGCSSANINAANTAGTPWEGGPTTLGCDCATDPISCDSVEFPTEASAAVVVLPYMVVAKSKWFT